MIGDVVSPALNLPIESIAADLRCDDSKCRKVD
jgi:hypothetical protein